MTVCAPIGAAQPIPSVSYWCDWDLVCATISSNVFELLGIRPEKVLKRHALWKLRISPEDRDRLLKRLTNTPEEETISAVHDIIDDDGIKVPVVHLLAKASNNGSYGIRGLIIPLTKDLRFATMDSTVVAQFTHKLGNHFQLLNLLLGSLSQSPTNTRAMKDLGMALDRIVEFTRSFSRFNQQPFLTSAVDLSDVLDGAVRVMEPIFDERHVRLNPAIQWAIAGAAVDADAYLLEQAFVCLLQNAVDAVESGGQISLVAQRMTHQLSEQPRARVLITDQGKGMEESIIASVREPFVSSKQDHDGLGLSTAIRIIEMHGGRLKITSVVNQGTEIEIVFPIVEKKADQKN